MGLTPTTQTVKRLEMERTVDLRPSKKQRVISEDEVNIWGSDYGDDIVMDDDETGPSNTERLVAISPAVNSADDNHLIAPNAEQANSPPSFTTSVQKGRREQNSLLYIPLCMNVSDDEKEDTTEWTLDSGASRHFTHDINDFVEYRLIKPWGIKTATSRTTVIAKGTILLKINGNTIRVGPVYHVPELTSKLLSLGEFLNDGLHTRGSSKEIVSRTQVLPNNITHLCQEIRDIKRGSTQDGNIDQINKLRRLSKHLSNTPDLDRGKHDRDGPGYAETEYNILHSAPPSDNPDNPSHCGPPQTPSRPESSGTPSVPPPPHVPSATSARTSSLASSNAVEDPEESPSGSTASRSPNSPAEIKASSRR